MDWLARNGYPCPDEDDDLDRGLDDDWNDEVYDAWKDDRLMEELFWGEDDAE